MSHSSQADKRLQEVHRYFRDWYDNRKEHDPIFASMQARQDYQSLIGRKLLPSSFWVYTFLPNFAEQFGLQRLIPTGPLPFFEVCRDLGAPGSLPPFFYT